VARHDLVGWRLGSLAPVAHLALRKVDVRARRAGPVAVDPLDRRAVALLRRRPVGLLGHLLLRRLRLFAAIAHGAHREVHVAAGWTGPIAVHARYRAPTSSPRAATTHAAAHAAAVATAHAHAHAAAHAAAVAAAHAHAGAAHTMHVHTSPRDGLPHSVPHLAEPGSRVATRLARDGDADARWLF